MRNAGLHDALREFALEAAALLTEDQREGAELEFDVEDESRRGGPSLYRYRPLTGSFIAARWARLRALESCARAADALGAGAAAYLRVNGLRGEQAEPALQAMLQRLYDDATSFRFPEERFEQVYRDVETTLYRDSVHMTVLAPLHGLRLEGDRVELGGGLALARGDAVDAPPEAVWPDDQGSDSQPAALCLLERDVSPDEPPPAADARECFGRLVEGLRLFKAGGVALGAVGWRRAEGRWAPVELGGTGVARGEPWTLAAGEEAELHDLLRSLSEAHAPGAVAWARSRFHMGCGRPIEAEALSDYLLALRALLDATGEAGAASLPLRLAALCAAEGERRAVQRRVERALALERFLMRGSSGEDLRHSIGSESPRALVVELERHTRALLRDVLCGYLDADLKTVAEEILLEVPDPVEVAARDLRGERRREAAFGAGVEAELEPEPGLEPEHEPELEPQPVPPPDPEFETEPALQPDRDLETEPREQVLQGVTPSADWPLDDDPESYSAPV